MWTEDQQKAIEAPVSDILVTAAAGSGKTAVMVERLISRIIAPDGADIDKLLVVTFTKAAASEIKERIAAKIAEKLSEGDNPRLKNQLLLINRASICTIHSFCLDILKNNFHLLGLDPNFSVGDTTETNILMAKAMGDVLDSHYDEEDADFLRVVNSFTRKNDEGLEKLILSMYHFVQSMPSPDDFLDMCCDMYSGDIDNSLSYILEEASAMADYALSFYKRAISLCPDDEAFSKVYDILCAEAELAEGICRLSGEDWDRVYDYIQGFSFSRMSSNKRMDRELFEGIKSLRDRGRELLKDIIVSKINLSRADIEGDVKYMRPCVEMLCRLVREFSDCFAQYKREKNVIDFYDIEHLTLKLLTEPEFSEVAEAQRQRFDEIYVDEYQDCNSVQEALFKAVSHECDGKPNMFMVGDMKQCIYRFRNANPMLFKHKSDTYTPYGDGGAYSKIVLSKNFRSRSEVLNGINLIFSRLMSESVGELTYSGEEYLYSGAAYEPVNEDTAFIDVCILDSAIVEDEEEKPASVQAEAAFVADKIRSLVNSGYIVYDKSAGSYRPVKYRDIAILLRGLKGGADYFADALSERGIPAFCDSDAAYFKSEEVQVLISFIKIISNPLDDVNLAALLRGPVYNFTDNQLLKIRTAHRQGYFYNALEKCSKGEGSIAAKARAFIKDIEGYRRKASVMGVDEFLWHLIDSTGYMEFISTLPNPAVKKTNIRTLLTCAQSYAASGGDMAGFSAYVEEITVSGGKRGAKLIGENDDVVRIMTIHKSKGLEFSVVFVGQCGKKFNTRDLSEPVLLHPELGMGVNYINTEKRFAYGLIPRNAIRDKIREENLSEEMRLLYVALTRAREKLFITGVVNGYSKFMEDIHEQCSGAEKALHPMIVSQVNTYLGWVCRAIYNEGEGAVTEVEGGGAFRKEIISVYDAAANASEEAETLSRAVPGEESPYRAEILKRLDYEYPHELQTRLPRNITVTEIKRIYELKEDDTYRLYRMPRLKKPAFAEECGGVSAAERGTLMHLCMEKIQLTDGVNHDTIKREVELLKEEGLISEAQASAIDTEAVADFFDSPVGRSMLKAERVYREVPFEILVEAEELFKSAETSEKIVVQGMIDAYFIDENGRAVLVDYKTDRRRSASVAEFKGEIAQRYQLQIYYYEKALALLTGRSVHKKYIYLFDIGEAIEII